ncbi:MAG: amidase domain-containing protein [Clostridium sp.]|nr:amidase domain-containing protein [Clostridium sp.]
MKRGIRIVTTVLLSMSMFLGMVQTGYAEENSALNVDNSSEIVENEIVSALTDKFSEYYSVDDVRLTLCGVHEDQGQWEYFYKAELSAMLRYASVEEMDYFQGMVDAAGIDLESVGTFASIGRAADAVSAELKPYVSAVFTYLDEEYEALEAYIGKQQIIPMYMKAVVDIDGNVELFMDAGEDYAPFDEFSLGTRDELKAEGVSCMEEELTAVRMRGVNSAEAYAARANGETNAVLYMISYTSNPTVCDYCGGACGAIRDRSKWNTSTYPVDYGHSDCADYVSQALRSAGFATDAQWAYNNGNSTWTSVSALISYMLSKGRIGIAPSGVIKVGYLVANSGHIMMVTAFDGVSYRYSAHTRDRRDAALTLGSGWTYYNVNYQ